MKLKSNVWLNILLTVAGAGTVIGGNLPPKAAGVVLAVAGTLKTMVSAIAQHYNTNGTPQSEPGGDAAPAAAGA